MSVFTPGWQGCVLCLGLFAALPALAGTATNTSGGSPARDLTLRGTNNCTTTLSLDPAGSTMGWTHGGSTDFADAGLVWLNGDVSGATYATVYHTAGAYNVVFGVNISVTSANCMTAGFSITAANIGGSDPLPVLVSTLGGITTGAPTAGEATLAAGVLTPTVIEAFQPYEDQSGGATVIGKDIAVHHGGTLVEGQWDRIVRFSHVPQL